MQADEMISAVQQSARIPTSEDAERAVRATLTVLGQRVTGGEASDLAAQLPEPLKSVVPTTGQAERFGLDEFYRRVAVAEGQGDEQQARQHARAVTALLREAHPHEFGHVVTQLPDDWGDLTHEDTVEH